MDEIKCNSYLFKFSKLFVPHNSRSTVEVGIVVFCQIFDIDYQIFNAI